MPFWWNDTGVWCGNIQQDLQYSQCGRCGDTLGETFANQGGRYDKAIISGTYTAGSVSVPVHFITRYEMIMDTSYSNSFSQLDH